MKHTNESHRIEYKEKLTDSLEKEVVAFLNSHEGGNIFIGIKSDGETLDVENKTAAKITYKERMEQPLWNKVALREAVINAIVHNDYTTEIPPVFEIYSDRIEITSSGGLSTIKNRDDFFEGYSKPINRELMRIYKDLEMVEHLGSGLDRILKTYGKESFKLSRNFMKNIFYKSDEGVNEGVNTLYELIKNKPNNRSTFFAQSMNTSVKNIERWLKQLKEEDKIEFRGVPKTGGYFAK